MPTVPTSHTPTSLDQRLKKLGLGHAADGLQALLDAVRTERLSPLDLLDRLVDHELHAREAARLERGRRRAGFPFLRTLEEFDFANQTDRRVSSLGGSLERSFVAQGRCLVLSGPTQSGKTHLAIAIGDRQLTHDVDVRFVSAAELLADLAIAEAGGRLDWAVGVWCEPELLVVDGLGAVPADAQATRRLFEVVHARHARRRSMVVTTTRAPADWAEMLGEATLAEGIARRLLERGRHVKLEGGKAQAVVHDQGIPIGVARPVAQVDYEELLITDEPDWLPPPPLPHLPTPAPLGAPLSLVASPPSEAVLAPSEIPTIVGLPEHLALSPRRLARTSGYVSRWSSQTPASSDPGQRRVG